MLTRPPVALGYISLQSFVHNHNTTDTDHADLPLITVQFYHPFYTVLHNELTLTLIVQLN